MAETFIHPSPESIAALQALDLDGPVTMLNLLRFAPDGGEAEYRRYGEAAMPFLQRSGATITFFGVGRTTVIGPDEWDEVVLVEYPSLRAFFDMTGDPDYPSDIRAGALSDSRLYCTQALARA